ncbi:MAG: hypothetical protein RLZZ312_1159 [Bacteroidota bacterium]
MKKYIQTLLLCGCTVTAFSQITAFKKQADDKANRWSLDLSAGQAKGVHPFSSGYFSSNRSQFLGNLQLNSFNLGARYMMSPKFGINFGLGYNSLKNNKASNSLPFEMTQYRYSMQGVVNAMRLFDIQESMGRVGLLFHGGLEATMQTPQMGVNKDKTDYNGGIIIGVTPQYRLSKSISIFGDVSTISYYRQHQTWDGATTVGNQNLVSRLITYSLGLSFSLGKDDIHHDRAKQQANSPDLSPLETKINKFEAMQIDTDRDGVADYLDLENASATGAMVDTKGRTIDQNRNGIADNLDKVLEQRVAAPVVQAAPVATQTAYTPAKSTFVPVYFDFNKATPNESANEAYPMIINYMNENPSDKIVIMGYADSIGSPAYNKALSLRRANIVKNELIKAGVKSSRLRVVSVGQVEDMDKTSENERQSVRRVNFKVE